MKACRMKVRAGWNRAAGLASMLGMLFAGLSALGAGMELGSIALLPASGVQELGMRPSAEMGVSLPPAKSLGECLKSLAFLSGVGGVAFGETAVPPPGWRVTGFSYDPARPDGKRLRAKAVTGGEEKEIEVQLADWILAPVVRYAAGDEPGCFTLFGHMADREEEARQARLGNDILGYHPAFTDTLLGLRLMQMDILILTENSCTLPREDGKLLLGQGEPPLDEAANRQRFAKMRGFLNTLPGGPFQSYVICDHLQEIRIGVKDGVLTLTGNPYWYCWRMKTSDKARRQEIMEKANEEGNRLLREELEKERARLSPAEFDRKYTPAVQQARFDELADKILSERLLQPMPDFSRQVSGKIRFLEGINPVVYDAVVAAMRHAAFFRHVRKESPEAYARLAAVLRDVRLDPAVRTPSIMVGSRK